MSDQDHIPNLTLQVLRGVRADIGGLRDFGGDRYCGHESRIRRLEQRMDVGRSGLE